MGTIKIPDPLGHKYDDDAAGHYDDVGERMMALGASSLLLRRWTHSWFRSCISLTFLIASQIQKVVHAIRLSPQRKQQWLNQVDPHNVSAHNEHQLMPILDVRTRWLSTHQMMRKFLYCI